MKENNVEKCSCGCEAPKVEEKCSCGCEAPKVEEKCSCGCEAPKVEEKCSCGCEAPKVEEKCSCGCEAPKVEEKCSCGCEAPKVEKKKVESEECCCCGAPQKPITMPQSDACCCGGENVVEATSKKTGLKKLDKGLQNHIIKLVVSFLFLIVGFFNWHHISGGHGFLMTFYYVNPAWVSVILCGLPIYKNAFKLLKNKKLKVPVLISIAMTASIALEITSFFVDFSSGSHGHSYVFAAGEIAFLMSLGSFIEDLTVKKCRSGISRLVSLIPKEANVKTENGLVKKLLKDIQIGDIVVVKAGEMIAVDGVIVKGDCSVDQSSLTGESLPVDLTEGDNVFGGSFNKSGVIEVSVTKLEKDMTIAKMAELTIEAEGKRAPISRVADKWVSIIIPSLFVVAIVVGLIAGLALKVGIVESIIRAITILVVFCPCSLVLATPTAIAAGLGNAAKNGVLVKSGASLEELSRVDTICFDKTGTLTEGNIELAYVKPFDMSDDELIKKVASIEMFSEHPLAVAVVNRCNKNDLYEVENIETLQGVGIVADINDNKISILSWKNAQSKGYDLSSVNDIANEQLELGRTLVTVFENDKLIGILAFSDTIKKNSPETVKSLNESGYNTIMLTGDNEKSAKTVADACNIKEVKHNLMPENKLEAIGEIQSQGHKVCMIGDGINDAPSLNMANVSMAMGAMGSDIAIDTADMAILNSDIKKVDETLKLSKRVIRKIKVNISMAMTINFVAVMLSLFGYLNPVTGALVHNCTSILVVSSSALLLYDRKRSAEKKAQKQASENK